MAVKWIKANYPGVRYYEHPERLYRGKRDRNFAIRYKKNGKTKEEGLGWSSGGMNEQKANLLRAEIVQNIKEGKSPQSLAEKRQIEAERIKTENEKREQEKKARTTFGKVAKEYLKWAKDNKKSYKSDESRYNNHLLYLSKINLKDISPLMLEKLKRDLKAKNLSEATIHQILALIRAIYRKAKGWELYKGRIPTESIKFPKPDNKRLRFLTHNEADKLLKALKEKSLQAYNQSLLALFCGLRFSEIANLTWADIDLPNEIIQIRDAKGGSRQSNMTEPIKEIFRSFNENKKHKNGDLIFPDNKGKKQEHISRSFWETVKELGFNKDVTDKRYNFSFHTLRHTFASWLAIQGTSLYEIKELMGHKSIQMTERYAHLLPSVKQKAVNRLAETFKEHIEKAASEKETQPKAVQQN
jgi:integrase